MMLSEVMEGAISEDNAGYPTGRTAMLLDSKRVPCWSETIDPKNGFPMVHHEDKARLYLTIYSAPKNWRIIGCISMACSF